MSKTAITITDVRFLHSRRKKSSPQNATVSNVSRMNANHEFKEQKLSVFPFLNFPFKLYADYAGRSTYLGIASLLRMYRYR
jgi:hypothetical protein